VTDASCFFVSGASSGNCFDIIMLNNGYQKADPETEASAFRCSRVPVFRRSLFFSFPSRQHDFFQVIF